jgi:hypothetical protein
MEDGKRIHVEQSEEILRRIERKIVTEEHAHE